MKKILLLILAMIIFTGYGNDELQAEFEKVSIDANLSNGFFGI